MKIDGGNGRIGIAIGDGSGFSSWRRAAVEKVCAMADESCDELRGFVLDNAEARLERSSSGDVSVLNSPRPGEERSGSEVDSFGEEPRFYLGTSKAGCGDGDRLVLPANPDGGIESVATDPAFDK